MHILLSGACWPMGGIRVVYENKTAESQSSRRTNDGDDYYQEANMLFFSSTGNGVNITSLRTLRLCG